MNAHPNPAETTRPCRYGEAGTLGAVQEITHAKVVQAARLVTEGRCYSPAQIFDPASPTQMWRHWRQSLTADRTMPGRAIDTNRLSFAEDVVAGALHSGTHRRRHHKESRIMKRTCIE